MKKFGSLSFRIAVLSTLLLVGSFLFTIQKSVSNAAVSDWQQGASIISRSAEDFRSESFKQSVLNLKNTGANYVSLIIPYHQTDLNSTDIMSGATTPSDDALIEGINYIHSLGMKVMLKPHLDPFNGQWRVLINPTDRATWYSKYGAMLNHLGDIGKQTNVESICIGTELVSMATYRTNPDNTQQWIKMINELRSRYNGELTYSANWGPSAYPFNDEKNYIGFWPNLDFIGFSAYFEMKTSETEYSHLHTAWDNYRKSDVEPIWNKYKKPIVFTEIGYRSVDGAHLQPWNYALSGGYNAKEQSDLLEALFRFWDSYSYVAGAHLWHWASNPNAGGQGNTDYTVQNKPAQGVVSKWFGGGSTNPGTTTPPNPNPNPGTTTPPVNPNPNPNPGTTTPPQGKIVPSVVTLDPSVIGKTVTISGLVNMRGGNGHVWFEYGTSPRSMPWKAGVKGTGGNATSTLAVQLKNLTSGTTYYYKIMAENYVGGFTKTIGLTKSFTAP